jgi:hypothetical protein
MNFSKVGKRKVERVVPNALSRARAIGLGTSRFTSGFHDSFLL